MRKFSKTIYLFLIAALMINLLIPTSITSAADELVNPVVSEEGQIVTDETVTDEIVTDESVTKENVTDESTTDKTVTESVYKAEKDTKTPIIITENLITKVVMKDGEGDNANNIEDIRPDQGSRVTIYFDWRLPENHGYKDGATFTFNLPDKFKVDRVLTGDLDGGVGEYEVTPEGKVTFTFNDSIEDNEELTGYFFVWREFEESKFEGGTQQEVVFEFTETDKVTIPVHFKSKNDREIKKSGTTNKGMNPNEISWEVDFNIGEKKIDGAVFKDELPDGLKIKENSIKVYPLKVQLDGNVIPGSQLTTVTPQLNGNGFELKLGNIDSAYRVEYITEITGTSDETYTNKATLSGSTGEIMKESASVNVKFSKPLDKKSTHYDSATQTITWAIQYNYNEQVIEQSKALIKDKFDKNHQQLDKDSFEVYEMTINDNGSASRKTGTPLVKGTDYTVNDTAEGFTLAFQNGVRAAYEIIYKTSAKERVHDDKYTVENKVEIDGTEETASRDINQVIFWKSADPKKVDYAAKTIEWNLSLNDDKKTMEEVVIRDSFAGQGLTFLPETLVVSGLKLDNGDGNGDYTIQPDPTYDEGFILEFKEPTSTNHFITYKTYFDSTRVNKVPYKNNAVLDWKENGKPQPSINKWATVDPDNYTKDNGNKMGIYNAETKEITWTIDVNYNLHKIQDAMVRDFYTGEQTFLPDSLTVHHLTLRGSSNGVDVGAEVPADKYSFEPKTENDKNGFELKLGSIDSAYRITYKTSLKGHPVAAVYSNKATLYDAETPNTVIFEKGTSVTPKFGGEYVIKTGRQGTGAEQDFAYWEVNINRSLSHIDAGATLTDTLSSNQILVKDSFKLYENKADASGNLSKGGLVDESEYTLDIQGNSFKLVFVNKIETSFVLEYQSFINADNGETITNNVTFQGQSSGTVDEKNENQVIVKFSGAGGGANSPGKGNLKVVKVDVASKKPLAGAKFGLYDKSGSNLLEELVTDENGLAVFKDYKYKDYMLKELSAPAGYLIDEEYKTGKIIKFKADKPDSTVEFTVENVKGNWAVELTKVDKDEQTWSLEGAVFKLQFLEGGKYSDVPGKTELTTDSNGKIQLTKLDPGSYQFIEIKAPKGYKLNANPIPFTIEPNQTSPKVLVALNEIYVGAVELLKEDTDTGSTLVGAEFELWDTEGHVLKRDLITDQDGKLFVDQLKAGSYQFVETKSPEGYILNLEPLKFEIIDDTKVQVVFKNKLETGSVKLTKIELGRPAIKLSGAEFRILDANKVPVKNREGKEIAGLTTDSKGELQIPELRPGKYYVEETRAPYGYSIKDKLTEIEVIGGKETVVTVENIRIPVTGGGGENNPNPPVGPNPPVNPDPEKPVKPDPEKPVDPTEPGETVDPVEPTNPTDPTDPGDGTDTNPPVDGGTESGGSDNSGENSNQGTKPTNGGNGKTPIESTKPQKPGSVLPKTGEDSPLPLQLAGFGSIVLGLALLVLRKKQVLHK
ncbi:Ig-like domain-containing protein [Paenibacillus sp. N3/727]|uniref:collagen binding domain-containing protein n=1 Tax=Paenibacillus sp. N3/727 TaxID=2925845 RepID=UPI001F534B09|nr:collagen binding domain-containing protein [Paenibacillus sp. N3/727]UNK17568.1 Ig-like domain-containing protein [Paenibacillus sp. N3/727]